MLDRKQERESLCLDAPNADPRLPVPYEEHHCKIKNGDLVFLGGAKSMFSWLISAVTRSVFSHVGIACWMRDTQDGKPELFIIEASPGGRRIISMDAYGLRRPMTVVGAPVAWTEYRDALLADTGHVPYGYMDLIGIGLKETLRIKTKDFDGEVCSEMVARALSAHGFKLDALQSPGSLYKALLERGCKIKLVTSPK